MSKAGILDLGGDTPADIALAAIAEIQQRLHRGSGLALRVVRTQGTEEKPVAAQHLA